MHVLLIYFDTIVCDNLSTWFNRVGKNLDLIMTSSNDDVEAVLDVNAVQAVTQHCIYLKPANT